MTRERKTAIYRLKAGILHFSTASFLIISQVNIGSAQADWTDKEASKSNPLSAYPLLAESRRDDWGFSKGGSEKQPQRQRQFSNNQGRKPGKISSNGRGNRGYDKGRTGKQPQRQGYISSNENSRRDRKTSKNRDHRDFKPRDHSDKRKVHRSEDRHRHHIKPRHSQTHRYPPSIVYPRHPHHRDRVVIHSFRHYRPHHRYHFRHHDIWGWLAFTAITLTILDHLNDQQQREYELAIYDATTLPLGETIFWREGTASGYVTPVQEGTSSEGRYCREFRHEVTIGGRVETLYGTACQNPDGSWEIVQ